MITQPKIDWDDIFKVKIRNFDESVDLHDIIKLVIMKMLVREHKKDRNYIRVYSEYPITIKNETRICDIYFENIRTKEAYAIEIQKNFSPKWIKETEKFYKDWNLEPKYKYYFKSADLILIPINKLSESIDIVKLKKEIKKFII